MTTPTSYTSVIDHTSDAGFRAWVAALIAGWISAGLVQTSDTGQINTSTVLRPATSVIGGYAIFKFSDSSLFLKVEFGTTTTAVNPELFITVGQGSNGSGTLTGQLSTRQTFGSRIAATSVATPFTSYLSHNGNSFSFIWGALGCSSGAFHMGTLCIGWSVDSAGARTSVMFGIYCGGTASAAGLFQTVRVSGTAITMGQHSLYGLIIGGVTSSLSGTNIQAYQTYMNGPDVEPFPWMVLYVIAEVTRFNTFPVAMVGGVSHTYLAQGRSSSVAGLQSNLTWDVAFIYE